MSGRFSPDRSRAGSCAGVSSRSTSASHSRFAPRSRPASRAVECQVLRSVGSVAAIAWAASIRLVRSAISERKRLTTRALAFAQTRASRFPCRAIALIFGPPRRRRALRRRRSRASLTYRRSRRDATPLVRERSSQAGYQPRPDGPFGCGAAALGWTNSAAPATRTQRRGAAVRGCCRSGGWLKGDRCLLAERRSRRTSVRMRSTPPRAAAFAAPGRNQQPHDRGAAVVLALSGGVRLGGRQVQRTTLRA